MCGISGILNFQNSFSKKKIEKIVTDMAGSISHRGPDDHNVWIDEKLYCALSHRRLSIIDLSKNGSQPMLSASKKSIICYNGEVYNRESLQKKIAINASKLKGHSDTELILENCEMFGVEETVKSLIGMFAFAFYDIVEESLYIVRDRVGIKPIYWGVLEDKSFIFASELKALRFHPNFSSEIFKDVIPNFLRHGYIPSPNTIYKNIYKLNPGNILKIDKNNSPSVKSYWSIPAIISDQRDRKFNDDSFAIDYLETLLTDAVSIRMFADVPVGAFLSGGVDSSTVVSLMKKINHDVKTFSIGFENEDYNEAIFAKNIAKHLGTDHTELYISSREAQKFIPDIPKYFDEPFADSSQIPTYLISEITRKKVKVALSGDGGDELFGGYNRYFVGQKLKMLFNLPNFAKKTLSKSINLLSPNQWNKIFKKIPKSLVPGQLGDKLYKLANIIDQDEDGFYRNLVSIWQDPENLVTQGFENKGLIWKNNFKEILPDFTERMQLIDFLTYLPDDILTKVDRSSMAVSLEARVPILDHRVVEFSWNIKKNLKVRHGVSKWILRQILYKYVPSKMIERPKMGFAVPIGDWLRGDLKDWALYLLSDEIFKKHSLLNREPIIQKWNEHQNQTRNWDSQLWHALMLHSWAEEYC